MKHGEPFDIAFKRAGGLAGKCYKAGLKEYNKQYHYYLKLNAAFVDRVDEIMEKVNAHTFPSNTVGPRSLSKSEANEVLNVILRTIE